MIVSDFSYVKPKSMDETLSLLNKQQNTTILAGGTDVLCNIKEDLLRPRLLIDIKGLHELKKIQLNNGELSIGSLVTFTQIIESQLIRENFPIIADASKAVGSVGVRNRATMTGNICSAVPCMDSGALLSAYEAKICTLSKNGRRKISVNDWFLGPRKTELKENELVTDIKIKANKHIGGYSKLARYSGEDLAQVTVAVIYFQKNNKYRVSFGSVGPVPIRAMKIESVLENNHFASPTLLRKVNKMVETTIRPITDIRATKEYRMHMAKVMLDRCIKTIRNKIK